jgi:hypothetical protein
MFARCRLSSIETIGAKFMQSDNPYVYDKAKYHLESVDDLGLPEEHAFNHTTYFLSWLVKSNLMSEWFCSESADELAKYKAGAASINELYEWWDTCLISDMLGEEGNAFASAYFDFERGNCIAGYQATLQRDLPSEFHVPYTAENEALIHAVISGRFMEWKSRLGT